MPFEKGHQRIAGRQKGTPNKRTQAVLGVIQAAAYAVGGVERMVAWIKESPENERVFWSQMYVRLLPTQLRASSDFATYEFSVREIGIEELASRLMERGLPPGLFGVEEEEQSGNKS